MVSTFGKLFPNDIPTAHSLFVSLMPKEKKSPTITKKGAADISLIDVVVHKDHATLLFGIVDPSIPDHVVIDKKSGKHRTNARGTDESPIISAHMIVNISSKFDKASIYPACIENNDYIARTYIVDHLNTLFSKHYTTKRSHINASGKQELKDWTPRINFGAAHDATVAGSLAAGGVLKGVRWVEQTIKNNTKGDETYPETERKEVYTTIANRPTGSSASSILRTISSRIDRKKTKRISIMLEDINGKSKVVSVDGNSTDVLAAIFIPQERVDLPSGSTISIFEDSIHPEYTKLLKELAK